MAVEKRILPKKIASGINQIFSIANMIRQELEVEYPKYIGIIKNQDTNIYNSR